MKTHTRFILITSFVLLMIIFAVYVGLYFGRTVQLQECEKAITETRNTCSQLNTNYIACSGNSALVSGFCVERLMARESTNIKEDLEYCQRKLSNKIKEISELEKAYQKCLDKSSGLDR